MHIHEMDSSEEDQLGDEDEEFLNEEVEVDKDKEDKEEEGYVAA